MKLERLKTLRAQFPGGLLLAISIAPVLILTPLDLSDLGNLVALLPAAGAAAVAAVLGTVYDARRLRGIAWDEPRTRVNENIKAWLLRCLANDSNLLAQAQALETQAVVDGVFYPIVDSDQSLTIKSSLVKRHGIFWSSLADLQVIGLFGVVVYFLLGLFGQSALLLILIAFPLAMFLFGLSLMPAATREHQKLSEDQLKVIVSKYCDAVRDHVEALLHAK